MSRETETYRCCRLLDNFVAESVLATVSESKPKTVRRIIFVGMLVTLVMFRIDIRFVFYMIVYCIMISRMQDSPRYNSEKTDDEAPNIKGARENQEPCPQYIPSKLAMYGDELGTDCEKTRSGWRVNARHKASKLAADNFRTRGR